MECCSGNKTAPEDEEEDLDGPMEDRSCTDDASSSDTIKAAARDLQIWERRTDILKRKKSYALLIAHC